MFFFNSLLLGCLSNNVLYKLIISYSLFISFGLLFLFLKILLEYGKYLSLIGPVILFLSFECAII